MDQSFRHLTIDDRLEYLKDHYDLSADEISLLKGRPLSTSIAEHLIENAIGYFQIPLGLATHFRIDGKDLLIPMAVEETSIIAASSATAKWIKNKGYITTQMIGNLIIGQIQIPQVKDPEQAKKRLESQIDLLIEASNEMLPNFVARGGGVKNISIRTLERPHQSGTMLVIHVLCDSCDAMGANMINQVCEGLKPKIEEITGEMVGLCILSNLVDTKLASARVVIEDIDPHMGQAICEATLFGELDPYRAATHNKGVLNGIDPILVATGNDWRAVEAGVHAYAARSGKYQPITTWKMENSDLVGEIKIPMAVGTVGGVTRIHPMAKIALKILEVSHSEELARICAAVGLVQNLGALKALSTVGIVRGHMELHTSNLAIAVGSTPSEVPQVRKRLTELVMQKKNIGTSVAQEILQELRAAPSEIGN